MVNNSLAGNNTYRSSRLHPAPCCRFLEIPKFILSAQSGIMFTLRPYRVSVLQVAISDALASIFIESLSTTASTFHSPSVYKNAFAQTSSFPFSFLLSHVSASIKFNGNESSLNFVKHLGLCFQLLSK